MTARHRDEEAGWLNADQEMHSSTTELDDADPANEEDQESSSPQSEAGQAGRRAIEQNLRQKIVVDKFPLETAGVPISQSDLSDFGYGLYTHLNKDPDNTNVYAPFASAMDWQVAHWAKTRGPGSTAMSELFHIPGVCLIICTYLPNSQI